MIDSNYRELVTEQEAKKWFGLRHIDKKIAISLVKVEADTKV